jgi:hypothetical protein
LVHLQPELVLIRFDPVAFIFERKEVVSEVDEFLVAFVLVERDNRHSVRKLEAERVAGIIDDEDVLSKEVHLLSLHRGCGLRGRGGP